MSPQKTKKQHYVPQNYLRRFVDANNKLFVFDKIQEKTYSASVGDVAQERYFYDIPVEALVPGSTDEYFDPQMMEKEFARIEGHFRIEVDALLNNTHRGITQQQRSTIAFFIMIQMIRTREFRSTMMDSYTHMGQWAGEMIAQLAMRHDLDMPSTKVTPIWTEGQQAALHAEIMADTEFQNEIVLHLYNHIWLLGLNNTAKPLYTSDHPAVKKAHIRSRPFSYDGVGSQGIEIAFPLTPNHILILRERSYHQSSALHDGKTIELTEGNVTYFNSLQVQRSYRQIYCSTDDFALVHQMLKSYVRKPSPR